MLLGFLESHSLLRRSFLKITSEAYKYLIIKSNASHLLSHEFLTCQWGVGSFSVPLCGAARAGGREVTLLWRPGNNGLFFPGSLLHPHYYPPIGPRSLTIHRDRKLWQTVPIVSANQWARQQGDSFSKWLSLKKSVFSSIGKKPRHLTSTHAHTHTHTHTKVSLWTMNWRLFMFSWVSSPNGNLLGLHDLSWHIFCHPAKCHNITFQSSKNTVSPYCQLLHMTVTVFWYSLVHSVFLRSYKGLHKRFSHWWEPLQSVHPSVRPSILT